MSVQNYKKVGIPVKHGDYYYFGYNPGLSNQNIMYKQKEKNDYKLDPNDPLKNAEVFLDTNTLSAEGTAAKGETSFSEDGKWYAYQINFKGSDWSNIYIKNTETK